MNIRKPNVFENYFDSTIYQRGNIVVYNLMLWIIITSSLILCLLWHASIMISAAYPSTSLTDSTQVFMIKRSIIRI